MIKLILWPCLNNIKTILQYKIKKKTTSPFSVIVATVSGCRYGVNLILSLAWRQHTALECLMVSCLLGMDSAMDGCTDSLLVFLWTFMLVSLSYWLWASFCWLLMMDFATNGGSDSVLAFLWISLFASLWDSLFDSFVLIVGFFWGFFVN